MSKAGTKTEKVCGKKKVNRYSKAVCESELSRLDNMNKNKDGVNMGDSSKYKAEIQARLATFN